MRYIDSAATYGRAELVAYTFIRNGKLPRSETGKLYTRETIIFSLEEAG
ncbi:MAG TPA: hypothetical protein VLM88_06995 [Proteiniclasticum sp.]|nr:hypothetical protein [Proteiniclasticum sp.]